MDLDFDHDEHETGGSKRPTKIVLKGLHPDTGEQVGHLTYLVPRRKADKILVDRLEVEPEHKGNGYGGQLMDEMQARHPGTPIDHGDRTDEGSNWWKSYTRGKSVQKGRTIAQRARPVTAAPVYYHGTSVPHVTHILPATQHGAGTLHDHHLSDPNYAYATTNLQDAWEYASEAHGQHSDRDPVSPGRPRVYAVHPIGSDHHVESDPKLDAQGRQRYPRSGDARSPVGFVVSHEMEPPPDVAELYDRDGDDWQHRMWRR